MLQRAKQLGCQLRPHMKTHKTIQGGVLATDGTKRCITVSTLAEAEFYADAGFEDICYAVPITAEKLPRAAQLHERCLFHVCVDHPQAVEARCGQANKPWSVFLMVDCGYGRDGVDVKDPTSVQLAQRLASSKGTRLAGLYTHGGHSYDASQVCCGDRLRAPRAVGLTAAKGVHSRCETLLQVPIVGVGSTPTCSNPPNQFPSEVTEMHPGNYIYYDTMQQALGSCSEEDIAVRVLTRVIGAYERRNLLLVDMGWTACSKQGPWAALVSQTDRQIGKEEPKSGLGQFGDVRSTSHGRREKTLHLLRRRLFFGWARCIRLEKL
ncbi:D-threo-3-hydroxyaspartate dehydratase (D-THA DH) (D-THA dehydratase) (Threo-3-hydroxy-D-aspartate ammonia-lyase) [Durusdinium trenchii]